jgi:hypothetical protein
MSIGPNIDRSARFEPFHAANAAGYGPGILLILAVIGLLTIVVLGGLGDPLSGAADTFISFP